jgi:hypothetical protein
LRAWWLLVVLAACGRLSFDPLGDGGGSASGDGSGDSGGDSAPPCTLGAWGSPQRLANLATPQNDWGPSLSDDALTLVWDSGAMGGDDLYVSLRATTADAFGPATALTVLNTTTQSEYSPTWLGQSLYFSQFDPIAMSGRTMVATYHGNGVFDAAVVVPEAVPGNALAFSITGLEGFYTYNPVAGMYYVQHMTRPALGADWVGDALLVFFTPSGTVTGWPSFDDGHQTLYFERTVGTNPSEIVATTRPDKTSAFGTAIPVNTGGTDDGDPEISRDGLTLVFASARAGGAGLSDLYIMTRTCQ